MSRTRVYPLPEFVFEVEEVLDGGVDLVEVFGGEGFVRVDWVRLGPDGLILFLAECNVHRRQSLFGVLVEFSGVRVTFFLWILKLFCSIRKVS